MTKENILQTLKELKPKITIEPPIKVLAVRHWGSLFSILGYSSYL